MLFDLKGGGAHKAMNAQLRCAIQHTAFAKLSLAKTVSRNKTIVDVKLMQTKGLHQLYKSNALLYRINSLLKHISN